jgi:hypothetical protein
VIHTDFEKVHPGQFPSTSWSTSAQVQGREVGAAEEGDYEVADAT